LSTLDPDADRAGLLDRRMRERLGTSLRYVLDEAADPLALEPSMLDGFLSRLQSAPVRPAAFGAYFELVLALERQDLAAAKTLLLEIAAASNHAADMTVVDLSEADSPDRYCRLLSGGMQPTALEMAEALVHESGHSLLFGLCADGPLVSGEDPARYASPLRSDLRPMDGIVHATFVSARMHRAVATLMEADALSHELLADASGALATHAGNCQQGLQTIASHARLTALGQTVCADVQTYLRTHQ
jgi:hypothetical protein